MRNKVIAKNIHHVKVLGPLSALVDERLLDEIASLADQYRFNKVEIKQSTVQRISRWWENDVLDKGNEQISHLTITFCKGVLRGNTNVKVVVNFKTNNPQPKIEDIRQDLFNQMPSGFAPKWQYSESIKTKEKINDLL